MLAIRLAALPRRGSLLGDVHESPVAADVHSIFDSGTARVVLAATSWLIEPVEELRER